MHGLIKKSFYWRFKHMRLVSLTRLLLISRIERERADSWMKTAATQEVNRSSLVCGGYGNLDRSWNLLRSTVWSFHLSSNGKMEGKLSVTYTPRRWRERKNLHKRFFLSFFSAEDWFSAFYVISYSLRFCKLLIHEKYDMSLLLYVVIFNGIHADLTYFHVILFALYMMNGFLSVTRRGRRNFSEDLKSSEDSFYSFLIYIHTKDENF